MFFFADPMDPCLMSEVEADVLQALHATPCMAAARGEAFLLLIQR